MVKLKKYYDQSKALADKSVILHNKLDNKYIT